MYKPAIVDYNDIPSEYLEGIHLLFENEDNVFEKGNIEYEWFPEDDEFNEFVDFNEWLKKEYGECEFYIIDT